MWNTARCRGFGAGTKSAKLNTETDTARALKQIKKGEKMPEERRKNGGEVVKLCQLLGIETLKDLKRFKQEEKEKGETVAEALKRYLAELQKNGFILKN